MSVQRFLEIIPALLKQAQALLGERGLGSPEETTKDKLLRPFLEALGYDSEYRALGGRIKSLEGTTTWVDYFLLSDVGRHPVLMLEAKSLWDTNIWEANKQQVSDYLRDYRLMIGDEQPILWIILSNFREWHVLRLEDREPFWSFTMQELEDPSFARQVYERFARENLHRERLQEFYTERQRRELDVRFLADLKTWRIILANGIRQNHPELSLAKIKEASQVILNRFLFIPLLEAYGQEPFYSLGRLYDTWEKTLGSIPFIKQLQMKFEATWVSYNTELFTKSWVDDLEIPTEYLESLILPDVIPSRKVAACLNGPLLGYRSIYNYNFTTLTQDVLGTAYEQFLAHELYEEKGLIRILEDQRTRKREGIYYTPEYIVRRIVHQTLQPRIKPKIDRAIELLQSGQYEEAYQEAASILELKVLDPACGSGSFLLGAFDYIKSELDRYNEAVRALRKGAAELLNEFDRYLIPSPEEQILVKMLYGVDLDPQAVALAKLSLWTRLLRARPGHYGREGATHARLPDLTLNIRLGNSLIHSPVDIAPVQAHLEQAADLAQIARDITRSEQERVEAAENLGTLIQKINLALNPELTFFFASDESLKSALRAIGREPDERVLDAVRSYITEGDKPAAIRDWSEAELKRLKAELMVLEVAREEVIVKRPFNWPVEFPDVFDSRLPEDQRGFDVVIGNPPYYNVDATFGRGAPELRWLKCAYPDIHTDKTDILFYFIRRAFQVLRPNGDLSFIVSRAFIQGDKAKNLRRFLAEKTTLLHVLDFLGHKIFRGGIATCILHARNASPPQGHALAVDNVLDFDRVRGVLESADPLSPFPSDAVSHAQIPQDELGEERWPLSPYAEIFSQIDRAGAKLAQSELGSFLKGIDTGLDEVFEGEFKGKFPDKWLRVRIPNSHVHKFGWEPSKTQILYITHRDDWEDLSPDIKRYLLKHETALKSRDVYKHPSSHYEWFQLHRPREALFKQKIFFPRRAPENRFAVDETGEIGFKSDVAAFLKNPSDPHDPYYICALLNSRVLEFRYRALGGLGKLTGRGMFEYFENQVGDLPIPTFDDPKNHPDHQRLSQLGREAHQLFDECYRLVTTYHAESQRLDHEMVPFKIYHDPAGDYSDFIEWRSPDPNREGHLLGLRVEPSLEGYVLWGEITEDEDWREGDREWIELARVEIRYPALRRFLLARAIYLTEFDEVFCRKQKFTSKMGNLIGATFKALTAPRYDKDQTRNLKIIENIEKRVASEVGRADLEVILLRQQEVEQEINDTAYRLYGVEQYRDVIEDALKIVL